MTYTIAERPMGSIHGYTPVKESGLMTLAQAVSLAETIRTELGLDVVAFNTSAV